MRSQTTFYFFIVDSQGRSAYWQDETVKWSTLPKPLQYSPDGWKETQPGFTRSQKYHGINRQLTTPYKFVEDGASILRYLQYKQNSYESKIYLIVTKWNDTTDIYEAYYRGEIDLVKAQDDAATGLSVNIVEGDLLKLLNANDDTDFEIPLDGAYTKTVQLNGISLATTQPYSQLSTGAQQYDLNHLPPFVQLSGDGTPVNIIFNAQQDYEAQSGTDSSFFTASQNYLLKLSDNAPASIAVRIRGRFKVSLVSSDDDRGVYILYIVTSTDAAFGVRTQLENHVFDNVGESYTFVFDETITVAPGTKIFIAGRSFVNTPGDSINYTMEYGDENISFAATDKYRNTLVKCIAPFDLYTELLKKVFADAAHTPVSTLLQTTYKHLLLTCGDAIRELDAPALKLSFAKFFDSFNKILFAGFGISGLNATLETRQTYYNPATVTVDIGEVTDLVITVAEDQLTNTAKVGYPNRDIESLNGKYAFNNTNVYSLPVLKVKKEYDQVASFLSDPYVIEGIRIKFDGQTTTDTKTDNNIFILNTIEKTGYTAITASWQAATTFAFLLTGQAAEIAKYAVGDFMILQNGSPANFNGTYTISSIAVSGSDLIVGVLEKPDEVATAFTTDISFPIILRRETYDSITGIPDDAEVYNIEDLTPKRMLLKHAPYYRSLLYFFSLERIDFTTADRNKELVTELNGVTISEKASVRVDTLGTPLFYPYVFSFKTRVPQAFMTLFNDAVNGHVQFSYNGFTLYGFPMQMTAKPDLNEAQEWKLLASPSCNIQQLVDLIANPLINFNMSTYGLSFSKLCPVQFVPQGVTLPDVYNFKHMDAATYAEQSTRYIGYRPYCAKWQTSDIISLQCISRNLGPVQVDIIDKYGRVYGTFPLAQITTTAVATPYQLFEGDIPLVDIEPGHYQLRCTAGITGTTVVFLSEMIEVAESWVNTLLFEYTNSRNQAATIFSTGYRPSFRIEAMIYDFTPKSRYSSYEDEPANMYLLDGTAYRQFSLFAGDSFGLPPYMIDKLNRIMTLNNVEIDGKKFVRSEDGQFESVGRIQGMPGTWWRMDIREALNQDAVSLTTDGELNQGVVLINVDTALFGDLSGQVSSNPIQVEVLEQ